MQLHIRHETVYRYGDPVKRSVQQLRLTPRRDRGQRPISWNIVAPGRRHAQIDAHGNTVHLLTLEEPHREINIVVNGVVETEDAPGDVPRADEGLLSPLAYLAETSLTRTEGSLREFALEQDLRAGEPETLLGLSEAVCSAVEYQSGATEVWTTAADAFTRRQGVCQDHSHIFIACCRVAGIPARYVSGYLYGGPEVEDPGSVASHAWVDVWLEKERGWTAVDVTHRMFADGRHCRLAVGRDYLDACPIRGVRRGGRNEQMSVAVTVATSAQQQ